MRFSAVVGGAGVILDDCQIDEIHMMRESVRKGGMVQVWLWSRDCDNMAA